MPAYTMDSNHQVYGGRFSMPSWRIGQPESTFKNISLNTLASAKPSTWSGSIGNANGPFSNWSGGIYADDHGKYGAYVTIGSGHLSPGAMIVAGAFLFDAETQLWSMKSGPEYDILELVTPLNTYGESTEQATLGHPTTPHTYGGIVYQPEASGGGVGGSALRNYFAGSDYGTVQCTHKFNFTGQFDVPQRVINHIPTANSYPATAQDRQRNGYWIVSQNLAGSICFVSYPNYEVSQFSNVDISVYGGNCITYIPAPYDCLVAIGNIGSSPNLQFAMHVSRIVGGTPQRWQRVTLAGSLETSNGGHGGVWSEILNCIVRYNGGGSNQVARITPPPPADILTQDWTFEYETLTGVDGAVPSFVHINNGTWNRFVESKQLRTFLWCGGVGQPVQSWRLRGM